MNFRCVRRTILPGILLFLFYGIRSSVFAASAADTTAAADTSKAADTADAKAKYSFDLFAALYSNAPFVADDNPKGFTQTYVQINFNRYTTYPKHRKFTDSNYKTYKELMTIQAQLLLIDSGQVKVRTRKAKNIQHTRSLNDTIASLDTTLAKLSDSVKKYTGTATSVAKKALLKYTTQHDSVKRLHDAGTNLLGQLAADEDTSGIGAIMSKVLSLISIEKELIDKVFKPSKIDEQFIKADLPTRVEESNQDLLLDTCEANLERINERIKSDSYKVEDTNKNWIHCVHGAKNFYVEVLYSANMENLQAYYDSSDKGKTSPTRYVNRLDLLDHANFQLCLHQNILYIVPHRREYWNTRIYLDAIADYVRTTVADSTFGQPFNVNTWCLGANLSAIFSTKWLKNTLTIEPRVQGLYVNPLSNTINPDLNFQYTNKSDYTNPVNSNPPKKLTVDPYPYAKVEVYFRYNLNKNKVSDTAQYDKSNIFLHLAYTSNFARSTNSEKYYNNFFVAQIGLVVNIKNALQSINK